MRYNNKKDSGKNVPDGDFLYMRRFFPHYGKTDFINGPLRVLLAGTLAGCKTKTVAKETGGYITMYLTTRSTISIRQMRTITPISPMSSA